MISILSITAQRPINTGRTNDYTGNTRSTQVFQTRTNQNENSKNVSQNEVKSFSARTTSIAGNLIVI